jgi:hypothetical protein
MMARAEDIVVTGSARKAVQEELGDLKLYRIPDKVTVAGHGQKQVAFLSAESVPVEQLYLTQISGGFADPPRLMLLIANRKDAGLGMPLPAGQVRLFENAGNRPILLGAASTDDKAVGELVELKLEPSPSVQANLTETSTTKRTTRYRLTLTNAMPRSVRHEARIVARPGTRVKGPGLIKQDGRWVWASIIPANGSVTFDYSVTRPD